MERSSGLNIFPRRVGSQSQYSNVKYYCLSESVLSGRGQGVDGGVGVEQSSRNGEIIWSKHLPKKCRLSKSVFQCEVLSVSVLSGQGQGVGGGFGVEE